MRRRYKASPIPTIFSASLAEKGSALEMFGFASQGENIFTLRLRYLLIIPLIYLGMGLFIDNLWRGVDSNTFSVLYGFKNYAEFQGELFRQAVATSPAYYRLLDFGVQILGNWFDAAVAMRLANLGLILGGAIAIYRTIRLVYTSDVASITALAAVSALGGLEFFHLTTPRVGAFFAIAVTIYGIALSLRRIYGGVIMGFGFVLSIMMGGGTLIPTIVPAIILLFIRRESAERKKIYQVAMLLAMSMMGVTLFNFFVFTGRTALEAGLWLPTNYFESFRDWASSAIRFIWFTMPLWPALIGFRNFARKQWTEVSLNLILLGGVGGLCAFPLSLFSVDSPIIMLPFLALLFAPAILLLNLQWQRGTYWFNFLFFTILVLVVLGLRLIWAYADDNSQLAFYVTQNHFPDFSPALDNLQIVLSILMLAIWFGFNLIGKKYFSWTLRPTISWIIGIFTFWGLMVVLWQPAVNHTKSYRPMIEEINRLIEGKCIDVTEAPFAFRVNWLYITDLRPVKPSMPINDKQNPSEKHCEYRLTLDGKISRDSLWISDAPAQRATGEKPRDEVRGDLATSPEIITPEEEIISRTQKVVWKEIKQFTRPGENNEIIVLYKREVQNINIRRGKNIR